METVSWGSCPRAFYKNYIDDTDSRILSEKLLKEE